jgi:hypothetical protein
MLGQRSLFDSIIDVPPSPKNNRGGRDPQLLQQRDEVIVARYYYLVRIKKTQYPEALATLRVQFFHSEIIIQRVLQRHYEQLKRFKEEKPPVGVFKKKYPWLVW